MAKDYKIHTILNTQGKVTVEIIGETPQAMQRAQRKYLTDYNPLGYNSRVTYETSTTCQITRWSKC